MFDDGNYKKETNRMHYTGWKDHYFKSSGVYMMVHCNIIKKILNTKSPTEAEVVGKSDYL